MRTAPARTPAAPTPADRDVARNSALLIVRAMLGLIMAAHGLQKLLGMGLGGVAGMLGTLGVPAPELFAAVVMLVELAGGIALMLGLFTRVAAALVALNMLVATLLLHLPRGFFVADGGVEFSLMLLAAAVAVGLAGPGVFSLDHLLWGRGRGQPGRTLAAALPYNAPQGPLRCLTPPSCGGPHDDSACAPRASGHRHG